MATQATTTLILDAKTKQRLKKLGTAWREYKETGLHVTGEEMEAWAAKLEKDPHAPPPEPHRWAMARVVWSQRAEQDSQRLHQFLAVRDARAAGQFGAAGMERMKWLVLHTCPNEGGEPDHAGPAEEQIEREDGPGAALFAKPGNDRGQQVEAGAAQAGKEDAEREQDGGGAGEACESLGFVGIGHTRDDGQERDDGHEGGAEPACVALA